MAVDNRQFESEFGFKSPGFSVDANGNITATSINAAGAGGGGGASGDYSVTTTGGNFRFTSNDFTVGAGDNPEITLTRGTSYSFTLSITTGTWNILTTGNVLYSTGIEHTADDGSITNGADAQGKTSGKFVFQVPGDAPDTLRYGDADGNPFGVINVTDPAALDATFANLTATGTTTLQNLTASELTVSGNGTVSGDFKVEGKLTGDSLIIDGRGVAEINSQTNIVLDAGNKIDIIVNNGLIGVIEEDGTTLPVKDTSINNTTIGITTPSSAVFTTGSVNTQPTTANGISNKIYTDNTATALAIALGV
jgi:hypothetical protein